MRRWRHPTSRDLLAAHPAHSELRWVQEPSKLGFLQHSHPLWDITGYHPNYFLLGFRATPSIPTLLLPRERRPAAGGFAGPKARGCEVLLRLPGCSACLPPGASRGLRRQGLRGRGLRGPPPGASRASGPPKSLPDFRGFPGGPRRFAPARGQDPSRGPPGRRPENVGAGLYSLQGENQCTFHWGGWRQGLPPDVREEPGRALYVHS